MIIFIAGLIRSRSVDQAIAGLDRVVKAFFALIQDGHLEYAEPQNRHLQAIVQRDKGMRSHHGCWLSPATLLSATSRTRIIVCESWLLPLLRENPTERTQPSRVGPRTLSPALACPA
jgi:hypothetical protein